MDFLLAVYVLPFRDLPDLDAQHRNKNKPKEYSGDSIKYRNET